MTTVYYRCKTSSGEEKIVSTLKEAKQVEQEGGTYKIDYNYKPSEEVGFARKFSRVAPTSHTKVREE